MSLKEKLKGIRYLRWVKLTSDSFSFKPNSIYPIIRVEGNDDLIVVDESSEEIYVEPEDLQFLIPVSDEEYRNENKRPKNPSGQQSQTSYSQPVIKVGPTVLELSDTQFPYWAQYITINNEGVWATTDAPDSVSKQKEKVLLETPIVIQIPKRKVPMDVLASWFKEGKITYEEFETEMKTMFGV